MSLNSQLKEANGAPSATIEGESIASSESSPVNELGNRPKLTISFLVIILAGAFFLYLLLLAPDKFGLLHDDSIYVTTAKSLAEGEGYRIISLPYEPAQTKYPPFYPFLLSLIWKAYPQFPENITLMMMLSVLATLGFLAMTWRYLVRQGYATNWQALLIVGLTAFNWRTMILATEMYTEMIYAALSVVALYLAEDYEKERKGWAASIGLGIVMGLAILTRSSGVALLIAVGGYYVLRRQWRRCLLSVGVGGLFVLGWIGWSYINRSEVEGVNAAYYTSYFGHLNEIVSDLASHDNASKLLVLLSIVGWNAFMLVVISPPVLCLGIDYASIQYFGFAFLFIAAGFIRHISRGLRLLHLYVLTYIVSHLLFPYNAYDRYVMLILPFLLLYLITELEQLARLVGRELRTAKEVTRKIGAAVIGLALIVAVGIAIYNYGSGIYWQIASASLKKTPGPAAEDAEAIEWIKANTDPSDVLVSSHDPMYYLYTGRKAVRSFPVNKSGAISFRNPKDGTDEQGELISRIIEESKGRYLILTPSDFGQQGDPQRIALNTLVEQYPEKFTSVFESTDGRSRIYRIENKER